MDTTAKFLKIVELLKDFVKENPLILAAIVVILFLAAVFWRILLLIFQGLLYATIALAAIIVVILVWAKFHYRRPSLKKLFSEKKRLLSAIKIAEKQYMRRKLSEKDFNKIFKEKQKRLIEVEALIDRLYNKEKKEKIDKRLLAVQTKKRHILQQKFAEKRSLIKEMDLAEKRYLRRKIDVKTYQSLVQKKQQKLIDIEAEIKGLYDEASISKIMGNLKKRLSSLENKKKKVKKKKSKTDAERQIEIANELAEQVSKKGK